MPDRVLHYRRISPRRPRRNGPRVQKGVAWVLLYLTAGATGFGLGSLVLHPFSGVILALSFMGALPVVLHLRDPDRWRALVALAALTLALIAVTYAVVMKTIVVRNDSPHKLTSFYISAEAGGNLTMLGTVRPGQEAQARFADFGFRGHYTISATLDDDTTLYQSRRDGGYAGPIPVYCRRLTIRATEAGQLVVEVE